MSATLGLVNLFVIVGSNDCEKYKEKVRHKI